MMLPDLFGDVVEPSVRVGDRSYRSLPLSVLLHGASLLILVLVALTAGDVLPAPPAMMAFVVPSAAPPAPPPPPAPAAAARQSAAASANPAAAPVAAPAEIRPETGIEPTPPAAEPGGVEGGLPGSVAGSGIAVVPEAPPPPPPPTAPIRVGGNIRPPLKVRHVPPEYPTLAIAARKEGVVVIEAEIDASGKVTDARILRSIPLLDQAALDAVRQWEFAPTLLNGVPAPILMVVTVNFFLTTAGAGVR